MTSILIIKTSSLGDVIHTLPALTDAYQQHPDLQCDWVVEEAFAEIPTWHPAVRRVIPVALRRWRKQWRQAYREWTHFKQLLTQQHYDYIIDAQGLLKSAILTYQARGLRCGLSAQSAREVLASFAYQQRFNIPKNQHAITRLRQLFAQILQDAPLTSMPDYGITQYFQQATLSLPKKNRVIFLHGTTWITKEWPQDHWVTLAHRLIAAGYSIHLPWGNAVEQQRAQQIASTHPHIHLIPKSNLRDTALALMQAKAVVGVDTGLAHLAAALAIPTITLYGATHPQLTGTWGQQQWQLSSAFPCSPCFSKKCACSPIFSIYPACYADLSVEKVWKTLEKILNLV